MPLIELDKKVFLKLYFFANSNKNINLFANKFSNMCKKLFYALYFLLIAYLVLNNSLETKIILIPFSVYLLLKIIRILIKRKRPYLVFSSLNLPKRKKYSFPSNHTGASFIISYTFLYLNVYIGIFLLIISAILGLCRILIGLHFPLDVLCGFLISTVASILFFTI